MKFQYHTKGTCSRSISLEIENGIVSHISFYGGCNGNLKAVSALAEGLTVEQIEAKCKGITCGMKPTSCPDQLARATRAAAEAEKAEKA